MKIMYISGTRADYGRMRPLLKKLKSSGLVDLNIFITGMHLKSEFGNTDKDIIKDFPNMTYSFDAFDNNSFTDISTMPLAIARLIEFLTSYILKNKIDFLILFGDRGEMLAGAIAASHLGVKIFHIAGGDFSGSIDDKYRDSITIFSNYHFVALSQHKSKIVNMNIDKERVYLVGSLDIASLVNVANNSVEKIINKYGINLMHDKYCILIYHPDVLNTEHIKPQLESILNNLERLLVDCIIISPNSDYGKSEITSIYSKINSKKYHFFDNIKYDDFINLLSHAEFIIGNSSAGIIESSFIPIPAINVGSRQNDRVKANNVIDVDGSIQSIDKAIKKIALCDFRAKMKETKNLYGDGDALDLIYEEMVKLMNIGR